MQDLGRNSRTADCLTPGLDIRPTPYVGRFAPSPTGPLHFGSLVAALASYCDAKLHDGQWLLRIDDIDTARVAAGSIDSIKTCLDVYGFAWDGDVIMQSARRPLYLDSLEQLKHDGLLYHCTCTRKKLAGQPVYPGFCRTDQPGYPRIEKDQALRLRVNDDGSQFSDKIQGVQTARLDTDLGDIVVWRRDAVFAYALVAAVDDSDGINRVIRGADLMATTHVQLYLMHRLGRPLPEYGHVPIALDTDHRKLGKQTRAPALDLKKPLVSLHAAWHFLGQEAMQAESISEFWQHAIQQWDIGRVPETTAAIHA